MKEHEQAVHRFANKLKISDLFSFSSRLSIGTKLLLVPVAIVVLLSFVAAAAWHGLELQREALSSLYEIRLKRLVTVSDGVNTARSINEEVLLLLSAFDEARQRGGDYSSIGNTVENIRRGYFEAKERFALAARERNLTELERDAFTDVLAALDGYGDELAQLLSEAKRGEEGDPHVRASMLQTWFGNFLSSGARLGELQNRLGGEDYQAAIETSGWVIRMLGSVLVFAFVMAVVGSLVLRRQIVKSLHAIRDAALQLREGDLTHRVAVRGQDEIALAGHAFNELIDSFQQAVAKVLDGSRQVSIAARSLSRAALDAEEGSARQIEGAAQVAATMQAMTLSIATVSDGARQVGDTSVRSLDGVAAGLSALQRVVGEIDSVRTAFGTINGSVGDFLERTAAITAMTGQIRSLAEQTNLLALNAAIEAARAGEQGRGFAVVADEVRKLAEGSSKAANGIAELTEALSGGSAHVGQSLSRGDDALCSSESHLSVFNEVFESTRGSVEIVTREIDEIASAVREQRLASELLAHSVEEISQMSSRNGKSVRETARAACDLEALAVDLEQSVAAFRI